MSLSTASSNGAPNPAFDSMNRKQDHSDGLGQSQSSKNELKGKKGKKHKKKLKKKLKKLKKKFKKLKKKLKKFEKKLQNTKKVDENSTYKYKNDQAMINHLTQRIEQLADIIMECCNPEIAKKHKNIRDSTQESEANDTVQC
ncbi:MAG TPA: hypothetical protein H9725_09370 [Candidatus Faecalibacterium gallistercoris]|uniref:Uncharacterized protein n=1 Tax=Candidatus Faecalibacterium gallistercoris TaxID=2838579 RepID=A0A9D2FHM2_9FIRM|nr:hypothetical protein [Candidatus Faecalibacterium gallistercoris]